MNTPHMVTINEAARLCIDNKVGISKNYIRLLVKQGAIPYVKCGVKVLLNYHGLLAYLSNPPENKAINAPGVRPVSENIS